MKDIKILQSRKSNSRVKCPFNCDSEIHEFNIHINADFRNLVRIEIQRKFNSELGNFKEKIELLEKTQKCPESKINDKLAELKKKVCSDKEKLTEQINKLDDIVKNLALYEYQLKSEHKSSFDETYYNNLIKNMDIKYNLMALTNCYTKEGMTEIQDSIRILNSELIDFENKLFLNKSIIYDPIRYEKDAFGNLIVIESLKGHSDAVSCLIMLSDGSLASGSRDSTIKIWDLNKKLTIKTLNGHTGPVTSLLSLSNENLASSSEDKTVKMWDIKEGKVLNTLTGHTDCVSVLTLLSSDYLASGSSDCTIKIWNINSGTLKKTIGHFEQPVHVLTSLPSGNLASVSRNNAIKIWDANEGTLLNILKGHTSCINALISLENGLLASASRDRTVRIWDVNECCLLNIFKGHQDVVLSLVYMKNGYLASGSRDNSIKIWDLHEGVLKKTLVGSDCPILALVSVSNGYLVSGSEDKMIKIWNINDNRTLFEPKRDLQACKEN
jgi:WD40 repeat protein